MSNNIGEEDNVKRILESIQEFFLIQSAKWEGYRAADHEFAKENLRQALSLENDRPKEAWEKFKDARRKNTVSFPGLRIAAFLLPIAATLVSYFVIKWLKAEETIGGYAIWFVSQFLLAYFPIILIYFTKLKETRMLYNTKRESKPILSTAFGAIMFMLNDILAVFGVIFFGSIFSLPILLLVPWLLGLPVNDPVSWPRAVYYSLVGLIILVGSSYYLTNMPFSSYLLPSNDYDGLGRANKRRWWKRSLTSMMRQILAGWVFNFGLISQTLFNLGYYLWTLWMAGAISQIPLTESILSGVLAGLMMRSTFKRLDDNPIIEHMALLGEARCMFRLGKIYGAQEKVWAVKDMSTIELIKVLAGCLNYYKLYVEPGWPDLIRSFNLQRARKIIDALFEHEWPYSDFYHTIDMLWQNSLQNSQLLILNSMLHEGMIRADHPILQTYKK